MNVEHLVLARRVKVASGGSAFTTLTLEAGTPYRHLVMWVRAVNSDKTPPSVTAQPLFGGVNDGASTNITDNDPAKVFQVPVEEVRPPTRGINKHPNDEVSPQIFKSELKLTNTDITASVEVILDVYIMAMATPGGA